MSIIKNFMNHHIHKFKSHPFKSFSLLVMMVGGLLPKISLADGPVGTSGGTITNPLTSTSIQDLIVKIVNAIVQIGLPIVVLMIMYTGFLFIKAQGNPAKLEEAKKALLWTVIGAAIVLGASALAIIINTTVKAL